MIMSRYNLDTSDHKYSQDNSNWLYKFEKLYSAHNMISHNDNIIELGGDRMCYHSYAFAYSHYLQEYINKQNMVLVEMGILGGVGLAIWSELFPRARILGLDIDLSNYENYKEYIVKCGGYDNIPETYMVDQLNINENTIRTIIGKDKIDIFIDDADHSDNAILNTLTTFLPYMADNFLYIIEDNRSIYNDITTLYPMYQVNKHRGLTVIRS